MNTSKWLAGVAALVVVGATWFTVREFRAAHEAADALAVTQWRSEELLGGIAALEMEIPVEIKRAEAVESDNAALAGAVQRAQAALATSVSAPSSRAAYAERLKQVLAQAKNENAEARALMRELLWCLDTGVARPELRANGATIFSVVSALGKLGERFPEALAELRERFEHGKRRVLGNANDTQPLGAMAAIARMLRDDTLMVVVFDEIPVGDARRTKVAIYAVEGLIAAHRYADALIGRTYASMSSTFELNLQDWTSGLLPAEAAEKAKAVMRNYAVTATAKNIEVLAGAGDLAHARELAGRLLAFDGAEATRALLQKHLTRAGQAGLLSQPQE
jgi:hypothetical protein